MHRSIHLVAAVAAATVVAFASVGSAAAGSPDAQLLRTYQPVTILHPDERLRPTKVQSFVADSQLERFDGTSWVVVDPDPEPGSLPGPGTGVWRLNQEDCSPTQPLGGLDCYVAAWQRGAGGDAAYGRVVRTPDAVVLQYWYFWYDNTYSYFSPPSDLIWQAHEGDWEVVNVVLSADELPVSVGYSRHCLGARRDWADIERRATHPVVYVAAGSHANYFSPGEHPFDPRCVPLAAQALLAQLGLPLPSDHVAVGDETGPAAAAERTTIHRFGPGWTEFPGFWGELEYLHAPVVGTVPFGTAPVGPAYKPIWHDPIAAMAAWPDE